MPSPLFSIWFSLPFSQLYGHFSFIIGKMRLLAWNEDYMRTISAIWSSWGPSPQWGPLVNALFSVRQNLLIKHAVFTAKFSILICRTEQVFLFKLNRSIFNEACIFAFLPTLICQRWPDHKVEVEEADQSRHDTKERKPRGLHKFLQFVKGLHQFLGRKQGLVLQKPPDEKPQGNADHRLDEHYSVDSASHLRSNKCIK